MTRTILGELTFIIKIKVLNKAESIYFSHAYHSTFPFFFFTSLKLKFSGKQYYKSDQLWILNE